MKAEEPKLLRVSRTAHELGLPPFTVRKWMKAGKIQAIRVGNEARLPRKGGEGAMTSEDRFTRFGQEYLETLFACFGVTLTGLEPGEEKTPEQERTDDLFAFIASFSGRLSGMRSHQQKE